MTDRSRWIPKVMVRHSLLILSLAALVSVGFLYYFNFSISQPTNQAVKTLQIAGSDSGYVASDACAKCHHQIWETYRQTGMGRSFARVGEASTIEDYNLKDTYYHGASDRYYTMYQKDGKFYQRRHQIGFDGKETNVMVKEMQFVLGSGNHSRSYLSQAADGRLVELPIGWYAEKGGYWAMNPGYDRPEHEDFRRQITYQCMFCHNGYPEIEKGGDAAGTAPIFRGSLPSGIDCQRCHGPGAAHIQAVETGRSPKGTIVNPAGLSRERQLELCMQCHLETTSFRLPSAIVRYTRGMFSYRPGEPLADYVLHFDRAAQSGTDDRFEIAHAAYRMRQSACFKESNPAMVCTTCHNPHDIPRGEAAARHYTAVCLGCHAEIIKKLATSNRHSTSEDCIGCHMPKRRTDDVVHVVMTDHYIQRRRPARDLLSPVAERIETDNNSYKGPVSLYYPPSRQDDAQGELYLAVAQVRQSANLATGTSLLAAAIEKHHPPEAEFYFELAEAYRKIGLPEKAIGMFREAVRRKSDFWPAMQGLGVTLAGAGQLTQAAETLLKALAAMPEDVSLLNDLGLVYVGMGKTQEAVEVLKKASRIGPDYPDSHNNLGATLLLLGDRAGAEVAYRTAILAKPDFAEAHKNLGDLLAGEDLLAEAQYHYQRALQSNPNYAVAHYAYGLLLARKEQFPEAKDQFEAANKADPNLAEAHNALGDVLSIQGDANRAIQSYRRAVAAKPGLASAQSNLGIALLLQGQVKGARQHLERAVALNPDLFEAHLYLGRALVQEHDTTAATAHYKKAATSPDPETRRAANEALQGLGLH